MIKYKYEYLDFSSIKNNKKVKLLNEMVIDLERSKRYASTEEFFLAPGKEQSEHINIVKHKMKQVDLLLDNMRNLLRLAPDLSDKLYLIEIFKKDNIEIKQNNLIVAPVGSGKEDLIPDRLLVNKKQTVLFLVSTEELKNELAPNDTEKRREICNKMFTSENPECFGSRSFRIHLMTYDEFGETIHKNKNYLSNNNIEQVICDEIYYLIEHGDNIPHISDIYKTIFDTNSNTQFIHFTATNRTIKEIQKINDNIEIYNYMEYPNVRKYVPKVYANLNTVERLNDYLDERTEGFNYYNLSGFAFTKSYDNIVEIKRIARSKGFKPLVISKNTKYIMSKREEKAYRDLVKNNEMPEGYDFLIYDFIECGWILEDNLAKLAFINVPSQTEVLQTLERMPRVADLLICDEF